MTDVQKQELKAALLRVFIAAGLKANTQPEMESFGVNDLIDSIHPVNNSTEDADHLVRGVFIGSVITEICDDHKIKIL